MKETTTENQVVWHRLQAEEVVQFLDVDLRPGLSAAEVKRRQQKDGSNRLTAQKGRSGTGIKMADLYVTIAFAVALVPLSWSGRKLQRWEGGLPLTNYAGYVA